MPESSKTVRNALQLLSCFTRSTATRSASELARQLKLPRTNVLRLLTTLEAFGFVERGKDASSFRIGIRAFEIGSLFLASNPVSSLLANALDELVARTQCTAYLAVLDKEDVVMLSCREGSLPIRFVWSVGDRLPSYTTAMGKAMLMHLAPSELDRQIGTRKKLRMLTANSIRTRDALNRDLAAARKRGWGFAREESHLGLTAVGSAILDQQSYPIAAISISYFDYPPQRKRAEKFAEIVIGIARDVSRKIASQNYDGRQVATPAVDLSIGPASMGQQSARTYNPPAHARIRR